MRSNRSKAGRGRSSVRRLHLISVVLAILAATSVPGPGVAQVPDNRDLRLDPEDAVPPAYRETLDARDGQRLDAARETGDTFLPLFQGPSIAPEEPRARGGRPARTAAAQERAPTPPPPAYEAWRRPGPAAPPHSGREGPGAGDLAGVLIEAWTRPPEIARVRYPAVATHAPGADGNGDFLPKRDRGPGTAASPLPRVTAGTGLYARTMYAVDSDYPGPVLLELLEPPLAGAVASGGFTLIGDRLVLRLTRLEYKGRSFAVDAWAAGLDCACYGVDGDVDSHWFERVLLPSAVRFAGGFLTALSRPSETVVIGDEVRYERREAAARDAVHAGLATAARTAGDVLLESAPDGPTVRIARDTELVVVFAAPPAGNDPDG